MSNHEGGSMKEAWTTNHGGGIMEESTWGKGREGMGDGVSEGKEFKIWVPKTIAFALWVTLWICCFRARGDQGVCCEVGVWSLESGSWKLEAGSRNLEAGSQKSEVRNMNINYREGYLL